MVTEGFPVRRRAVAGDVRSLELPQMNLSPDGGATPAPRTEGDLAAMHAAYESGMCSTGDIDIPIIDWRHYLEDELDMHHSHQSFAARQRMLDHGGAGNQVIWFTDARPAVAFDQTPLAFEVIDEWMRNIKAHPWRSVSKNRPARAVDSSRDRRKLLHSGKDVWAASDTGLLGGPGSSRSTPHAAVDGGPTGRRLMPAAVVGRRDRGRPVWELGARCRSACALGGGLPDGGVRLQPAGCGPTTELRDPDEEAELRALVRYGMRRRSRRSRRRGRRRTPRRSAEQ